MSISRYFSAVDAAGTVPAMATMPLVEARITRERYWRLVAEGVIGPDDRVELLEGVIVAMSPQDPPHAFVIAKLTGWLGRAIGNEATLRVQLPLDLNDVSTPGPDIAIVAGRPEDHAAAHPTTALLVVEVADSSMIQDRLTKGPMYAAAGVGEYWIVNVRERCVEIHREPVSVERRYRDVVRVGAGDTVSVGTLPGVTMPVAEILPPAR